MSNFNFDLDNSIDEDFFGSLKGNQTSKLHQLFGEEALSADDKQQSLKYQRPKANDLKRKDAAKNSASTTNVACITLMAKVVTAYCRGKLQGKVGMALIQNADNSFNIIMYKNKSYILATLKLQAKQELLYKQAKYWQFYDEASIYWSFNFDNPTDEEEFIEKLNTKSIVFKESQVEVGDVETSIEIPSLKHELENKNFEELPEQVSLSASSKETKNSLIKRMAKMGKPLPTLSSANPQTATDFSDSSDTEVIKTLTKARNSKLSTIKTNQHLVSYNTPANTVASAVYPINQLESQYMQMVLTEQRTQGSELRMNMNKLENKIEKVLDKLELYDKTDAKQKPEKDDEILELEEKLLMLKKENRKLKQNLQELSGKESEENKLKHIIYEFKEDFKQFNIDYKQNVHMILKDLTDKYKESLQLTQETQKKLEAIKLTVEIRENDLSSKATQILELQNEISLMKQQENDLNARAREAELEGLKQKQIALDFEKQLQEKSQEKTKNLDDSIVKSIMNNLYVDIAEKLDNSNLSQTGKILSLIASSIRQQTLKSLQQLKD